MDGADRDAGVEVPAIEIDVLVVVVDAGRIAAATTVLLSGSVGVAGRSFSGPAGAGRGARRCATASNHVVGASLDSRKTAKGSNVDPRGYVIR